MKPSHKTIKAKWNRKWSDLRCFVGKRLIALGSVITDATILSTSKGRWTRKGPNKNTFGFFG